MLIPTSSVVNDGNYFYVRGSNPLSSNLNNYKL